MASSDLREELDCSICLNLYTDPVMLKCGHNFCQDCIDRVFDSQEGSGDYFCPQCRKEFQERPSPHRNITLRNITERFLSSPPPEPEPEKSGIFCTYCIHSSVPAVKSCLHCEASLCDDHLRVHSKSPEHVICVPTSTPENKKCPVHKKILEYYCTEDSTCICISCSLTGEHRGHQLETLQEASIKNKKKLINNLQKLITKREETEERVQSLKEHRGKVQGKVDGEEKRVLNLYRDLRRRLEDLEKRVLGEISRQAKGVLSPVNDLIQELELKTEDLSRKIRHLEELCAMTDPLTVLQELDSGDTEDGDDEYRKRHEKLLRDGGDLDVTAVSHTLGQALSDVISGAIGGIYIQKADILLNEDTANKYVCISRDKKTVSETGKNQNLPKRSERFAKYAQVLGSQSFSSGRHYWEVDVQKSNNWRIGMSYNRIDRDGDDSLIGDNHVSWVLDRTGKKYSLIHDRNDIELPDNIPVKRVRVYLDYEAGQISFYMGPPLRHLHTFTATFTEPLYAVLGVWHSSISLS